MKPGQFNSYPQPNNINRLLVAIIAVLLITIVVILVKLPISPPQGPPHLPPGWPKKFGKLKTVSGVVAGYKSNPHFDVNAITIKTGTDGLLTLDFLPHTANLIMDIAQKGQSVVARYSAHPNDEVVGYQLRQIKNTLTGKSIELNELPPPPDVPDRKAENFRIEDPQLLTDQYGGIVALQKNNMLFHFKPGLVDDIGPLIKKSRILYLTAVKRDDAGFVNINNDQVFVVMSVTINNRTFLVR